MPQQLQKTTRNVFNKGLITEFSELSFPNEASVDELNCTLKKAGNRTKRLAIEYEDNYALSSETYSQDDLFATGTWYNVGGEASVEFLVVQTGQYLRFYKKTPSALSQEEVPISYSNSNPYILDMSTFEIAGGLGAANSTVEVTSIEGNLVVASPQIDTFYISRDCSTGAFTATAITFRIRDFKWLGEFAKYYYDPISSGAVSIMRKYDTNNAGWAAENLNYTNPLTTYISSTGNYPPLTHPWHSGKTAGGYFGVPEFGRVYSGTSFISNGHYILDLFDQDREAVSGIAGVNATVDSCNEPSGRFSAIESYSGRVFYAGVDNRVYYSQIIEDMSLIGELLQRNDPTAEYSNDLLDTDGGYIKIPSAHNIRKLHTFGSSILVFAENGVWRITGPDGVFRPTDFSVYRITDLGISTKKSFVIGDNAQPFWWSYSGIHTVQVTDQGGMVEVSLTDDTIKTFWNALDSNAKAKVVGSYDQLNKTAIWAFPSNGETVNSKRNRLLLLNIDIGAFYPWEVSDEAADTNFIVGMSSYAGAVSDTVTYNVIDSSGNQVQDSSGNDVVQDIELRAVGSSTIKFLVFDGSTSSITFAEFKGSDFLDWGSADYSAYAESAYNFMGDLTRFKNSPYITVYLKRTETGWSDNGDGTYDLVRPSSLKVSGYWDFKSSPSTTAQEAYRFKYPLVAPGEIDYPNDIISTRLKLRGRGKVLKLRFEATEGHDFDLLGWETIDAINPGF